MSDCASARAVPASPGAGPGSLPAEAGDYLAAAAVVVGWLVFQAVLERVLPAEVAEGCPLPPRQYLSNIQGVLIHDGKERRLKYRCAARLQHPRACPEAGDNAIVLLEGIVLLPGSPCLARAMLVLLWL